MGKLLSNEQTLPENIEVVYPVTDKQSGSRKKDVTQSEVLQQTNERQSLQSYSTAQMSCTLQLKSAKLKCFFVFVSILKKF